MTAKLRLGIVRGLTSRGRLPAALAALLITAIMPYFTGCRSHDFPDYPAPYREYAYVSNGGSNTVTVLDVVNVRQDRVIPVGSNPTGIAVNPVRNEVYVVNSGSNSVSVIDAENKRVVATIGVRRQPYFIAVNAQGTRAYVANSGSNNVSVIDLATRREIAAVGVGEAPGMAKISPDGHTLVVSNRISGSVSIVDAASQRVRSVFGGCPGATDIAILPDSSKAFIACSGGAQVMDVQLASAPPPPSRVRRNASEPRGDALLALLDVGKTPVSLALKPDGGEIFVANYDSGSVSEIDTNTNEVGAAYLVGTHPVRGLVSADNSTLYISDFDADSLGVFSVDDAQLVGTSRTGDGPDAMAFSTAGHLLFAVDARSGDVAVIRTLAHTLLTLLPAGTRPNEIAIKAFNVR